MTHDEIKEACDKFRNYLEANDSRVISMVVGFADGKNIYTGTTESLEESLLIVLADRFGLQVSPKP